jgi:hypothetical protein
VHCGEGFQPAIMQAAIMQARCLHHNHHSNACTTMLSAP